MSTNLFTLGRKKTAKWCDALQQIYLLLWEEKMETMKSKLKNLKITVDFIFDLKNSIKVRYILCIF